MTPAALANLIRTAAITVLSTRGLDTSALPAEVTVERPRHPEHGDYATNLALQVGKRLGITPQEFATWLADAIASEPAIDTVDIAGPGFLNFRLAADAQGEILREALAAGSNFGHTKRLAEQNINLEFVSANPTGPIHLGGTRWAAVGDALGRILETQGASVTREYYFNDAGAQIDRFVRSLIAAASGESTPEDGYGGSYITDIAAHVLDQRPDALTLPEPERAETFRRIGVGFMFEEVKASLHNFGTDFDVYFHENSLHESGAVAKAVETLKASGNLYEKDGAWWLRSSNFGDEKDRVVIKRDGTPAYIAGDIAYYQDKRARGFNLCIYMLGADHGGYVRRLKAAAAALGDDPNTVEVLIGQLVNLVSDGKPVRMSKRAGTVITLEDLVDAVGVDAARFSLVLSSVDSSIDIDLDLLRKHSSENPVFYVQYAHARATKVLNSAMKLGVALDGPEQIDFGLLTLDREGTLIRTLGEFPKVLASAAELREPHRVARYLEQLAGAFHKYYDDKSELARVLPRAGENISARAIPQLYLYLATQQVLRNGLGLLGVSAPEHM